MSQKPSHESNNCQQRFLELCMAWEIAGIKSFHIRGSFIHLLVEEILKVDHHRTLNLINFKVNKPFQVSSFNNLPSFDFFLLHILKEHWLFCPLQPSVANNFLASCKNSFPNLRWCLDVLDLYSYYTCISNHYGSYIQHPCHVWKILFFCSCPWPLTLATFLPSLPWWSLSFERQCGLELNTYSLNINHYGDILSATANQSFLDEGCKMLLSKCIKIETELAVYFYVHLAESPVM